jgi:adenine-specific DNA-methyltransferase
MPNKRHFLQSLSRPVLLDLARFFQIPGISNKPKDDIINALMAKRSITVEEILGQLSRDDLKGICEALGLDSSGKEKNVLIERISGEKMEPQAGKEKKEGRNSGTEYSFAKQANNTEKDAKAYVHEESKVSLRPEIGTQAQFRKKKPPKTYKYDSSLSPELEYDGQNPAREQGEALIGNILEAKTIEEAKEAANKLKAMSKPFLNWAGKAERLSFDVPTLPLFVHERLSTKAIIETLKSHQKKSGKDAEAIDFLSEMFGDPHHSITDQVLKAYEYQDKWTNRMVLGDSLVVMNSLLHYENMGGQVQTIYFDPPYGVKFGSNFQPFVRKRDVKNSDDESMTREPEMVKAYRDTWELGLHSYLTYMRDRLLVARDLLKDTGSVFVQISDENVHHVREVMDEVFGGENFCSLIQFTKTSGQTRDLLPVVNDYILWYAKDSTAVKYQHTYQRKTVGEEGATEYFYVELANGEERRLTDEEFSNPSILPEGSKIFATDSVVSEGYTPEGSKDIELRHNGKKYVLSCGTKRHWKPGIDGMKVLWESGRLLRREGLRIYKRYFSDFPYSPYNSMWTDTRGETAMQYVVQTSKKAIERCLLMTTDPGDLILDPTCGSGTAAFVAEQWGRRWITADVSRVPLALARQRLLTATFPYFELKEEKRGPVGGFVYKRKQNKKGEEVGGIVPHIMLESIANNNPPKEEVLVDRPEVDNKIVRITGPFAFEATIPTPVDYEGDGIEDSGADMQERGSFVDRMLEVLRQSPVIQLPGNKSLSLKNIRLPSKTLSLSAEAIVPATEIGKPGNISDKPLAIVFGPESGAVSEKLVYEAAKEANAKSYSHLLVIGFAIQPNARDLIEKAEAAIGIPATYVQMTPDLMMGDLLKNMRSSQIFSVCGLPDVKVKKVKDGKYQVELLGLDIFDPSTMEHHPLNGDDVPAWFLDTDYNGLCFHVCQAFFPRTGAWESLKKALKGSYEESVWDHLAGTLSEPFEPGEQKTIAVKVIDDRGNELLVTKALT